MGLDIVELLIATNEPFYGIIPKKPVIPHGHVILLISFGTVESYMKEYITFEVADFDSLYQAIFE